MLITTLHWRTSPMALIFAMLTGFVVSVLWIGTGLDGHINGVLPSFASALIVHRLMVVLNRKSA